MAGKPKRSSREALGGTSSQWIELALPAINTIPKGHAPSRAVNCSVRPLNDLSEGQSDRSGEHFTQPVVAERLVLGDPSGPSEIVHQIPGRNAHAATIHEVLNVPVIGVDPTDAQMSQGAVLRLRDHVIALSELRRFPISEVTIRAEDGFTLNPLGDPIRNCLMLEVRDTRLIDRP